MRRISAFHVLVVVMLAVGVGATTAIFSVVNGVLLRPLPFPDPQQLVLVGEQSPQLQSASQQFQFFDTPAAIAAWREQASDFQAMAALQNTSFTLAGQGEPRVLHGVRVTPAFFDVLEAKPELGRFFVPADAADGSAPMVITDALWRSAFDADPGVIGRTVGAPGREARVIGVLPARFHIGGSELGPMTAGRPTEFFLPFEFGPNFGGDLKSVWSNFNFTVIARLKPGVTVGQALAQLNLIQGRLAADAPDKAPGMTLQGQITPVLDYATHTSRQALWLLLGAVGAVLLTISVNLGGLWVSRVVDRRRDWAIRIALGAEPGRLARQVLGEGLTLGLVGGALGVACAAAALQGLLALAPKEVPRLGQAQVDWRVLAVGLSLSAVAGLLTGLLPALRAGRGDPQDSLKAGSAATTAGPASVRSRQGLIGLQAALTTLLVAVAGLLGVSLYRLMTKPTGFSSEHAVEAQVVTWSYQREQCDRIMQQLPAAVAAIPGVRAVGLTSHLPLEGETWIDGAGVPGKRYPPAQAPTVNVRFIGGDYFSLCERGRVHLVPDVTVVAPLGMAPRAGEPLGQTRPARRVEEDASCSRLPGQRIFPDAPRPRDVARAGARERHAPHVERGAAEHVGGRIVRRQRDAGGRGASAVGIVVFAAQGDDPDHRERRIGREGVELGDGAVAFAGDEERVSGPPVDDRARLAERRRRDHREGAADRVGGRVARIRAGVGVGRVRLEQRGGARGGQRSVVGEQQHIERGGAEPRLLAHDAQRVPRREQAQAVG